MTQPDEMVHDSPPRDWIEWHRRYEVDGRLARRLAIVRRHVEAAARARAGGPLRVLSLCAGDGRDLVEPLRDAGAAPVSGRLIEIEPALAQAARRAIAAAGLDGLDVLEGDAGTTAALEGAVPADLVLLCGIFGNISDEDIERTVRAMPRACAAGATVIWTRHRRPPDRTPAIRDWFASTGFRHIAFEPVPDSEGSVGVERFNGSPRPLEAGVRLFTFRPMAGP